jgi:hypothetical protein
MEASIGGKQWRRAKLAGCAAYGLQHCNTFPRSRCYAGGRQGEHAALHLSGLLPLGFQHHSIAA